MKGPENTITMSGEPMEVFIGASCLAGCKPKEAAELPLILPKLCESLSSRSVARYFIRNIRIGETIALVDRNLGYSFRLKMEVHAVCILSINKNLSPPVGSVQVFYLANSRLLHSVKRMAVAA